MLVLTRGANETIVVDDDIRITIIEIKPNGQVRIGIEAPPEVPIHRLEIWEQIHGGEA